MTASAARYAEGPPDPQVGATASAWSVGALRQGAGEKIERNGFSNPPSGVGGNPSAGFISVGKGLAS